MLKRCQSGLIVQEYPVPPPPQRGPLEFKSDDERTEAAAAIGTLFRLTGSQGLATDDWATNRARRHALWALAHLYLGEDFEIEELC